MKIILEHPTSPGCMCQRAATCWTPLPAPWKHHQLQHKEMTQGITTSISTEETEVPPAQHTEKGATQRGRGSIINPAAHQCLRIPPLGPLSCVSQGEQTGCPGQRPMLYFSGLADSTLRWNQGHETPVTELSATLKSAGPQWKLPCPTL